MSQERRSASLSRTKQPLRVPTSRHRLRHRSHLRLDSLLVETGRIGELIARTVRSQVGSAGQQAHAGLRVGQHRRGDRACARGTERHQAIELGVIGHQRRVPLADRREVLDDRLGDVDLEVPVALAGVARLERGDRLAGHAVQDLEQVRDAGLGLPVVPDLAPGVGHGALELAADDVGRVEHQQLAVLARQRRGRHLALRLLEVADARRGLRDRGLRGREELAVARVEALRDVARELEVLALILAHGHAVGEVEQDVGGLQHGIGEEADRDRLAAGRLLLERDHAPELAHRADAVEEPRELGVLVHVALHEDDRALGIEPGGDERGERVARRGRQLGGLERLRHRVQVDDAEDRLGAVAPPDLRRNGGSRRDSCRCASGLSAECRKRHASLRSRVAKGARC